MKNIFILLLFCTLCLDTKAQRIIGELETNAGFDGVEAADSMMMRDAAENDKKKKINIPTDVKAWTVDPIYCDPSETFVDTLQHLFQNDDHSEGREGNFSSLSNLGLPRLNRIYVERQPMAEYIFTYPLDQFITQPSDFRHYNTKSPYMNLTYTWSGDKRTGHDRFRATYANNVGKRINFGGIFDYFYGMGEYDHQATSFMKATGFASYTGERYDMHFHYTHDYMKWSENGGLENDLYITNPEDQPQQYSANEIPTRLTATWNKLESDELALNHRYHLGFLRTDSDSISVRETFVPVTSFFHSFLLQKYGKSFIDEEATTSTYHTNNFMSFDTKADRMRHVLVLNHIGISLREGFNKYAVAGLSAYVGFRHATYQMPDIGMSGATYYRTKVKASENDVLVGGKIQRTGGKYLHYNATANFVVAGDNAGNLNINGIAELNIPLLGDTAQIQLHGLVSHYGADYHQEHFHNRRAWWDTTLDKTIQTRVGGTITVPHTHTQLSLNVENIKNYIYFANIGTDVVVEGETYRTNNISIAQNSGNIQIISASLRQDLKFGPVHLDNVITWQNSTNKDVLPLPALNTYSNLYLSFLVAKVLHCEIGGDMTYFTRYYAPDYSPALGMFTTQDKNSRIRIGNYPLVSVYANVLLKKCRFYVQYYHVNQSDGRYFWAPHYPMNPGGLRFGISWNFYD